MIRPVITQDIHKLKFKVIRDLKYLCKILEYSL